MDDIQGPQAEGLGKSYHGRPVVRDVSISLKRGEAVGLLGPNGAGKTTCFYMICGLVMAERGIVKLEGTNITKLPMHMRARLGIGYLPQEASIFRGMTVSENIMAVLELVWDNKQERKQRLEELMEEFTITHLRDAPAIALSGGERRRLEIARALATDPGYVLLDEPFAGIDPIAVGGIQRLVSHLKDRGIGVLITDHNVRETLRLIDRAHIMHHAQLLHEGTPQSVIDNEAVRCVYLGDKFYL